MINARVCLFGTLRSFVEQNLCGLVTWKDMTIDPALPTEKVAHGRRNPFGKFKEIVTVRFGDYTLTARSPDADPPLGWLKLEYDHGCEQGPLDQSVLDMMGKFIRSRGMKVRDHGRRRTESISGQWGGPA